MSTAATPRLVPVVLFIALAVGLGMALPSQAQDPGEALSATERSKLDGRFERIAEKAQANQLEQAIGEMPRPPQRQQTDRLEAQKQALGTQSKGQFEAAPDIQGSNASSEGAARYSVFDVRPDARAPEGTPLYDAIVHSETPSTLRGGAEVSVLSTFDGVSTIRATPTGLRALAQDEAVSRIQSPRLAKPHNDVGAAEVGARTLNSGAVNNTAYKGEGTIGCVIDSGIDWSHPDFTDENGNTRIRAIWDQVEETSSTSTPVENDASRFRTNFNPDYGAEFLRQDIQAALDGSGSINQKDVNGHGTHVAGTVAASGEAYKRSSGVEKYRGVAPEAELIAVKAGNGSFGTTDIINGITYCQDLAEEAGKPLVINMSLGSDFAPHDGSSFLARSVEDLVGGGSNPGTAVVVSAGNSGSPFSPIHTSTTVSAGDSADVSIDVTSYTPNSGQLNDFYRATLWAYQPGPYTVSVYSPGQQDTVTVSIDGSQDITATTPRGTVYLESSTEGNGRYFDVQAYDGDESSPPTDGQWTVRIRQEGDQGTELHGWFLSSQLGSSGSASFSNADNQYTIGSPGTSKGAITVGNYIHRTRWTTASGSSLGYSASSTGLYRDIITPSSSRGPTVDGRTKPDIAAPGTFTASALSADSSPNSDFVVGDGEHVLKLGTSMSSPLTAGSVALLLQEDPTLSTNEVRSLLKNTARTDGAVEASGVPNQSFGAGKLNVLRALTSLRGSESQLEVLSYEDPFDIGQDGQAESVTLGGTEAERAALRFTPTIQGQVSGAYLSLYSSNPSSALTDSLYVEVWSDDGSGTPQSQIGAQVAVSPSALTGFTPNFIDLTSAGAEVQADEDYHIVVYPKNETDEIGLFAETADGTAGRSATFDGSSWGDLGSDLVLRTQIRTETISPPAVASAILDTSEPQNVSFSWSGVEAEDLVGYYIFRDTAPISNPTDLAPYDTVETGTTSYTDVETDVGNTYYYRIASVDQVGNASALSPSVSALLYPTSVQANVSRSFDDGGADPDDYRLVALPGTADRSVGEVLSGEPEVDWFAVWDDGSESDFLVEYDGSGTFTFNAGRGFWVVSKNGLSVSESFSTVSLQSDTAATISLHDGWNIISNPFGKDVAWSAVDAANGGSLQPLFGFDGTFSEQSTFASSTGGEAFYFLNDQNLDELTIPYPGAPTSSSSSTSALASSETTADALALEASPVGSDASDATSRIRIRTAEGEGTSGRDVVAPPQTFEAVSLRIRDDEADRARTQLLSTTTRSFQEGQTLPLVLQTQEATSVRLRIRHQALEGQTVALIRPEQGTSYELHGDDGVTVDVGKEPARLKLAVGSEHYVNGKKQDVAPEEVTLTSAPNPFRQRATIHYALPEEAQVRLEVFDILGRRVATLVDAQKEAGRHRVQLSASTLSSGVYFGRMRVDDRVLTQKITVVR